ncbi:MAG: hypothetical protein ABI868_01165 [Acidobacteriota bacterium]
MIADDERALFFTNALRVDDDDPDDDDDLEDEDEDDDEDDDEEEDDDEPETWQVSPKNRFPLNGASA